MVPHHPLLSLRVCGHQSLRFSNHQANFASIKLSKPQSTSKIFTILNPARANRIFHCATVRSLAVFKAIIAISVLVARKLAPAGNNLFLQEKWGYPRCIAFSIFSNILVHSLSWNESMKTSILFTDDPLLICRKHVKNPLCAYCAWWWCKMLVYTRNCESGLKRECSILLHSSHKAHVPPTSSKI